MPALGYEDGLKHAHDFLQGLTKENPFAGKTGFGDLGSTPSAPAVAPAATTPAATAPAASTHIYPQPAATPPTPTAPSAPLSTASVNNRTSQPSYVPGSLSPFNTGFFNKTANGGGANALPRTQSPAVGDTRAVPPVKPDAVANAKTGMTNVTPYQVPGTPMSTTYDSTPGTRRPFIGGKLPDGSWGNVAGDFIAGGRFSSQKAGSDPTLDQSYAANLPRTPDGAKISSAPAAAAPPTRTASRSFSSSSTSSIPRSGPNTDSPSAHTVADFEEPGYGLTAPPRPSSFTPNAAGLPRARNQRAASTTRPKIFGG